MRDPKQSSLNEWLVICSQRGEKDAFASLVENWQSRYYLYALDRLQDKEAAMDVTQDCLLSISRSITNLDDPVAFPKWSFRILERRCVDWLRKTIRERAKLEYRAEVPELAVEDTIEASLSIEQLLAKLDSRLATIVRLYYLESLRISEIAEICDLAPGTVKSRLYYARKQLSKVLAE